ncbi:MAG TPA: hypothetical protein VME24_06650 [Alphaproteobacteria bacterium]|nr:hypothetical protein [Alphaproteobacteria bacterium]
MTRATKTTIVAAIVLAVILITIVGIKSFPPYRANPEPATGLSLIGLKVTADIQPDSTILAQCTVDETNTTSRAIGVDNVNDVNIGDVRRALDESGKSLKISRRPQGGVFVTLAKPIPPGGTISYTIEFGMKNFFKKNSAGEYEAGMAANVGNVTEAHVVYVWRLPPGATLLEINQEMAATTSGGHTELTFDRMIPPNGTFPIKFRYRPPIAAN